MDTNYYHDHDLVVLREVVVVGVADFHEKGLGHQQFGNFALDAEVHKVDGPRAELSLLRGINPDSVANGLVVGEHLEELQVHLLVVLFLVGVLRSLLQHCLLKII